jgi:hypothetical protein
MKKGRLSYLAAVALAAIALALPATASAGTDPFGQVCRNGGGGSAVCSNNTGGNDPIAGPNGAIVNITSILALIAGIVSVAFMVWGGVKYISSGGDSSGVSTAKNTIIAALVGLLLAVLAKPIVVFIVSRI